MGREVDTAECGHVPDAHLAPGKCDGGGPIGGVGWLALREWAGEDLQSYYFDSGASCNFSPGADKIINYAVQQNCGNGKQSITSGGRSRQPRYLFSFWHGNGAYGID